MATEKLAVGLAGKGFYVFPVHHDEEENTKKPLTKNGHLDATLDPGLISDWWHKHPNAKVGVAVGKSDLVVADIDTKNGVDGWESLGNAWLDIPETYSYETGTGGTHLIYRAPGGVELNGVAKYRGMPGVDRRGGSSWVMWVGGVPALYDISEAPEWLVDPVVEREAHNFEGGLKTWYEGLLPGEPNVLVRKAIERISEDMSHSEMVDAQHSAIRLGAEGNPGVPYLIEAIEEAWMNRPAEMHTTPESEWESKFHEALQTGIEKYGELTQQLQELPNYSIALVPASVQDKLVLEDTGKSGFSLLLGALVRELSDDNTVASILWNCPATKDLSREWGLQFIHMRIREARKVPEPERENPRIEEQRDKPRYSTGDPELLTEEEREYISKRPTFVDHVEETARGLGYDQLPYFRSVGWTCAAMAFSFKGFIPLKGAHSFPLNLWNISMGLSGTGKTATQQFRDAILKVIFEGDGAETSYDLGSDSSQQGINLALLERDGLPSFFGADEASGFFKGLEARDWNAGFPDMLSKWYDGNVPPSNKINLKEFRGKSARTAFTIQMFATPDRLVESLSREMFNTGFLARFNWVIGLPPKIDKSRFAFEQSQEVKTFDQVPPEVDELAKDLMASRQWMGDRPIPLLATQEAAQRIAEAHERMYNIAKDRENFDIIEPSVTRLADSMKKCAAICAMYREDSSIVLEDALHAIKAVEEWFTNLFIVAGLISEGDFQRDCALIEGWIAAQQGSKASRAKVFHRFRNIIQKDPRELESRINFLVESGIINRKEVNGGIAYELNGSLT